MKKTFRFIIIFLIILSLSVPISLYAMGAGDLDVALEVDDEEDFEIIFDVAFAGDSEITSKAAIVIDYYTGIVIFEHNADELRVPASMVKMVAVHVVLDAIKDGFVNLNTIVDISNRTRAFSYNRAFSNVPLLLESTYTISELLDVVIVRSASAATIALGEAIFGSEEALIGKMNEKAATLGVIAEFHDSWGGSPFNRVSARGMAEMTRALIKEHPEVLEITSQSYVVFDETEYNNTNWLLSNFEGLDGFKTGFTNPAGWCFTGTAVQGGRRIISVTMGSEPGFRFPDSTILLNYGFSSFNQTMAHHFRNAVNPLYSNPLYTNPISPRIIVPIILYNIEEASHFTLRDLALILGNN